MFYVKSMLCHISYFVPAFNFRCLSSILCSIRPVRSHMPKSPKLFRTFQTILTLMFPLEQLCASVLLLHSTYPGHCAHTATTLQFYKIKFASLPFPSYPSFRLRTLPVAPPLFHIHTLTPDSTHLIH